MLTVLAILGVLVVLFGTAVLATREGEVLRDAPADAADLALPRGRLAAEDVRRVRFGLAFRGYRMSEVDELLDRLADQLVEAAPTPVVPSEPPLESPPVHPRAADVVLPVTAPPPGPEAPPVEVAQAPVEIAPLPAGEPSELPRD